MQASRAPLRFWINGAKDSGAISPLDRGLAYGDGLFETMRLHRGDIPLLPWHMRRLLAACTRLQLRLDAALIESEIAMFLAETPDRARDGIIKLIVTRGTGGRGYACAGDLSPTRILLQFSMPDVPQSWYVEGVAVRYCESRLGTNPALAGVKHLNRLEQVLARMEWDDPAIAEGLMADARGRIVEGISSNLFLVSGGRLLTPVIETCGVAGVMRQYVLDESAPALGIQVAEGMCERALISGAQELFLCNAVNGVWPIRQLGNKIWPVGPVTRKVQGHVARLFPV